MGKPKRERDLADTEAQAITRNIRVSPRKLNLVAGLIRGRSAQDAVATLTFSKRRIAQTAAAGALTGTTTESGFMGQTSR